MFAKKAFELLKDESGNVESALVLLPLLILVLSILQLAVGVFGREVVGSNTQSAVTRSGLYSSDGMSPMERMASNGITHAAGLALPGGGVLYVGERFIRLPGITPLLAQGEQFASTGVTIGESP